MAQEETWTEDEIEQLRQLKAKGEKLPVIMRILNKTKGQVQGKWNRMNGYKTPGCENYQGDLWTEERLTERWADRKNERARLRQ